MCDCVCLSMRVIVYEGVCLSVCDCVSAYECVSVFIHMCMCVSVSVC